MVTSTATGTASPGISAEAAAITIIAAVVGYLLSVRSERIQRAFAAIGGRRKIRRLVADADAAAPDNSGDAFIVSALHIHPIKSLRPVSVLSASVGPLGLDGDRCLMVVKASPSSASADPATSTHRFVTQRQVASLATIKASLPTTFDDGVSKTIIRLSVETTGGSKKRKSVHVDITPSMLTKCPVRYRAGIWDDTVEVVDVGDEAAQFVRNVIAQDGDKTARQLYGDVRVVSIIPGVTYRELDERYLPPAAFTWTGGVPRTALNDGFPILVACEASLQELNRRLIKSGKDPIPMSRFRPNIVIRGTRPFEEDTWKSILIRDGKGGKGTVLHIVKGCPRCKQSCTDQLTGERSTEPLGTMATFRALGTSKDDVYFAQNAVPHGNGGVVSVGDDVIVLERGEPVWDKDTVQAE
mmetsp:Transcript_7073/g.16950  ORF Transcript_7073/g.16950 Transcript_7073/m.16950 type:complete len:412 (+) Transcript_7073:28-1263(+)